VLAGRAELLLATAPFLAALAWSRLTSLADDFTVTHEITADRVFEGEPVTVRVTVSAHRAMALVEVGEPLPRAVRVADGRTHTVLVLAEGERVEWQYQLECARRGRLVLGTLHVRVWDRAGLRALEIQRRDPKSVRVYPRAVALRRLPAPLNTQTSAGNYVGRTAGEGIEPAEIRPFAPGDRIRSVNWRASLRLATLYVTQQHQERNADVVLMLDTLAESGPADQTTLDVCARAVASLASAYLRRKDRVGFIEYGATSRWIRPGSGGMQQERVLDGLVQAAVAQTFVTKDLTLVPPRVLPPQALVIAVSPLLDERFTRAAVDLVKRGFDVVVLGVSPIALTRQAVRPSPIVDLACRLWALERQGALAAARRSGLTVLEWDPQEPLEVAMAHPGRRRRRLTRVG
jgi:uncharacterized protein (DUF58 family)